MPAEVTCLICFYSHDDLEKFRSAIESIFNQIDVELNIVLVVDGPIPLNSKTFIESIADRLYLIELPINVGHGEARRIGLSKIDTEFISIFDADDYSYPNRLRLSIDYLKKNQNVGVVSGIIREIWETNQISFRNCSKIDYKYSSTVNQNCCTFRTAAYNESGEYLHWFCNEDTYLWIRMINQGWDIGFVQEILTDVNMNVSSLKRRRGVKYFISEIRLRIFMYNSNQINLFELFLNISYRIVLQLILPFFVYKKIYLWKREK